MKIVSFLVTLISLIALTTERSRFKVQEVKSCRKDEDCKKYPTKTQCRKAAGQSKGECSKPK